MYIIQTKNYSKKSNYDGIRYFKRQTDYLKELNSICSMYITQTTKPSYHKICDVKQTGLRKVRLRDNIGIKSEIEATTNSSIPCLIQVELGNIL